MNQDKTDPFTYTKTHILQLNRFTFSDIAAKSDDASTKQHAEVTGDKADQMLFKCHPSVVPGSHKQRQMITLMARHFFKHVS